MSRSKVRLPAQVRQPYEVYLNGVPQRLGVDYSVREGSLVFERELHARGEDAEAVLDFGVAYATLQCAELLAAGAPGIHFYTLNRSPATRAILSALKLARPWEKAVYPGSISSPSATRGEPSAAS